MDTYLSKKGCGIQIVYDQGELERHLKMGWEVLPDDWMERELAVRKARRAAELKAEAAALEAEVAEAAPRKPGRPKKIEQAA